MVDERQAIVTKLLEKIAAEQDLITYTDAASPVGMDPGSYEFWAMLGRISRESYEKNKILLSALVINRRECLPGNDFYRLAVDLGYDTDTLTFWVDAVRAVHNCYRRSA